MIKQVFIGISSIVGFLGALVIGMQLEQRISAVDSEKKEKIAFENGLRQAENNYRAAEGPMSVFARELRRVLGSDEATSGLPATFATQLDAALLKAEDGDFEAASAALPKGVKLAVMDNCLNLTAGDLVLETGQTFDTCKFKNFVAVKSANFNDYMTLVVDGSEIRVQQFKQTQFNSQCRVLFLKAEGNGHESKATVRFNCT